jgi:TPR repeat protein
MAAGWFRKAAEQGHLSAQSSLGLAYVEGAGVPQDACEGVEWFKKSASQDDPVGLYNLGLAYHLGICLPRSPQQFFRLTELSARLGYAPAQSNLGAAYGEGIGVERDDSKAIEYYRMAAMQNYALAQLNLALLLRDVQPLGSRFVEALAWLHVAAANLPDEHKRLAQGPMVQWSGTMALPDYVAARKMADEISQSLGGPVYDG